MSRNWEYATECSSVGIHQNRITALSHWKFNIFFSYPRSRISMVTNQNRLTPIFRFLFLFDKFEGNTFLHNVLKNLVPSMSLYPSFRQMSKLAISHRDTFQRNKTGYKPLFCYDNLSDTNIKRPL